jgi:hypothetical protein
MDTDPERAAALRELYDAHRERTRIGEDEEDRREGERLRRLIEEASDNGFVRED